MLYVLSCLLNKDCIYKKTTYLKKSLSECNIIVANYANDAFLGEVWKGK